MGMFPSANADVPQTAASSEPPDAFRERFPTAALPVPAEGETTATSTRSDTLTKADRLERSYETTPVKSVSIEPTETPSKPSDQTKIISWHWHDPLDHSKAVAMQPSTKRKIARATATHPRIANERIPRP
jgi:hypothetical protein